MKTAPADIQPALALEEPEIAPLREAYNRTNYARRGITFARAMHAKGLRIALECYAEAIARQRNATTTR